MTRLALFAAAVILSAAVHLAVLTTIAHASSTAPECDGAPYDKPGPRARMLHLACRVAHNAPPDNADPNTPVGEQYLVISVKGRRPGVVRDGDLRYVTYTAHRGPGQRVTWPMVFTVASGRVEVLAGSRCRMLIRSESQRPDAFERAYITQVMGNGPCPPEWEAQTASLRGRVFAPGDGALIRSQVRQRARANGWRRVGRVEFTSPHNDGTFSTANVFVTARKGRFEQCEAFVRWTPGTGYVTVWAKDANLENTGDCVPDEDPL